MEELNVSELTDLSLLSVSFEMSPNRYYGLEIKMTTNFGVEQIFRFTDIISSTYKRVLQLNMEVIARKNNWDPIQEFLIFTEVERRVRKALVSFDRDNRNRLDPSDPNSYVKLSGRLFIEANS